MSYRNTNDCSLALEQDGGIHICLSEKEFADRKAQLEILYSHQNGKFKYEMLDRKALLDIQPGLGPDVVGGSWCPHDGHVNPLYLLRSLHNCFLTRNGQLLHDAEVFDITHEERCFRCV